MPSPLAKQYREQLAKDDLIFRTEENDALFREESLRVLEEIKARGEREASGQA